MLRLNAVGDAQGGAVRLRFQRRCMTTDVDIHARGLAPGRYTLWLDASAAASFEIGTGGGNIFSTNTGGSAGAYGGGAGGTNGAAAQGIIVITYTPNLSTKSWIVG